jgi:two-component system response regulator
VSTLPPDSPAQILLVDDDDNYAFLTRKAFGRSKLNANLHHVGDGVECLKFLRRQEPYTDAPVPDIILLDIEMPKMDGREVLAEIVNEDSLKHLAVVVLTSRAEHAEILRMYQLRCNTYICKPAEFDKYVEIIQKLADYWLSVAKLPSRVAK